MYSLSAMDPEALPRVARKLHAALRPGGRLLLRDYGRWDEAQLRFKVGLWVVGLCVLGCVG